jgi:flagellar protein FliO/FliZ
MDAGAGLSALLWFLFILLLIPLVLWLLKRSSLLGPGQVMMETRAVSSLALSPNQRVVTVEVGDGPQRRWLVLGVTAQQIAPLYIYEDPPWAALEAPAEDDWEHPSSPALATIAQPARPWAQALSQTLRQFRHKRTHTSA